MTAGAALAAGQGSFGTIRGVIRAGTSPLPGVSVSATNTLTGVRMTSSTDVDGSYELAIPARGRYVVRAELAGFAPLTAEAVIVPGATLATANLSLTLLSRARSPEQQQQRQLQQVAAAINGRGFQNLSVTADNSALPHEGETGMPSGGMAGMTSGMAPGMASDTATQSVSISGGMARTDSTELNSEEIRQRIQEFRERNQREDGGMEGGRNFRIGGGPRGSGGPGGPGGPPGGGVMIFGGPGRHFNVNKPHGAVFYSLHDAAFDARPFALSGQPVAKPAYSQQRFGALLGGPFKIPKLYDGSAKNFMFLAFFVNRSANPFDAFSTVPTLAERAGDFSGAVVPNGAGAGNPVQIYDPTTHQPFAGNVIPQSRLDPAARLLLRFVPLPNAPGAIRNFHFSTVTHSNNQNVNLHFVHNFGAGGPVVMLGPRLGGAPGAKRANINFGLSYNGGDDGRALPFPSLAGQDRTRALNVNFGALYGRGKVTNFFNSSFNRSRTRSTNLYAYQENIAREAGLNGVSQDPFDYGVPSLSFTNFSGTSDVVPLLRRDQTIAFSDSLAINRGRSNWRLGGDFRFLELNPDTDSNARGSYVFTGLFTSQRNGRAAVPGTGFDLADYLLGLPQQTSRRFGASSNYFRGKSLSLFLQNDWRVAGSLTLDLGLRYEYVTPFREKYNRLVNLDVAAGFTQVVPVTPDQTSPFNNAFGPGLLQPDKHAFAPRLGVAWKPMAKTVVRAGYGVNFNTGAYANIVSQLASQPPFAQTETLIAGPQTPLTLENGFPAVPAATVLNSYAVDRNYRMGYVQLFNLGVQRDLGRGVIMNLDYNGSKGTRLDMLRSPNRGRTGLRLAGVQPFFYESSEGDSIMHGASLRLRRRMQRGLALGGTYTFSKSIDNASSIGGVGSYVAQNDLDLAAERGLSSFDVRHHLSTDAIYELPWGSNKRWLAGAGLAPKLLGDWTISGVLTLASGSPFTARVLGNAGDVARGTNGTLRADATGAPVALAHPNASAFFNTAAFTTPVAGQFGTAGRNTIPGPGTVNVDLAFNKTIPLAEGRAWEVRAQAFNLLNHAEFAALDTVVNSPTYGQVTAVRSMRRFELSTRFRF